jgi:hypothetical protein
MVARRPPPGNCQGFAEEAMLEHERNDKLGKDAAAAREAKRGRERREDAHAGDRPRKTSEEGGILRALREEPPQRD